VKVKKEKLVPKMDLGPDVQVNFKNLETPGARLDFTFQGRTFNLDHDSMVTIPISVALHLNELTFPVYTENIDPATGQSKTIVSKANRFFCTPAKGEGGNFNIAQDAWDKMDPRNQGNKVVIAEFKSLRKNNISAWVEKNLDRLKESPADVLAVLQVKWEGLILKTPFPLTQE
jgi:hypothetical protein